MKTYIVLFAEDVPCYGSAAIEAENDAAALEAAKAFKLSDVTTDPSWDLSVCKRIVNIEDPEGNIIAEEISLEDCFLRYGGERERILCDAAPAMVEALEVCEDVLSDVARLDDGTPSVSALNMVRDILAKTEGGR
jgi:hypothetical protein